MICCKFKKVIVLLVNVLVSFVALPCFAEGEEKKLNGELSPVACSVSQFRGPKPFDARDCADVSRKGLFTKHVEIPPTFTGPGSFVDISCSMQWFLGDGYEYNHGISRLACAFSAASYSLIYDDEGNFIKDNCLGKMYRDFGFSADSIFYSYKDSEDENFHDSIAFSLRNRSCRTERG